MKTFILDVQTDENGEAFIQFPDDVMKELDWNEGDTIKWTDNLDGSWTLTKKTT